MRASVLGASGMQGYSSGPGSTRLQRHWQWWYPCVLAVLLMEGALCPAGVSHARPPHPVRIGALTESWGPTPPIIGLRDGLIALGYQDNKDFFLGIRFTQGDRTALTSAAQELLAAGATLLFADSNGTAKALQEATTQVPMVFAAVEDPVGTGLVRSFAQPGGNSTGVASLDIELGPKRLQVFTELVPGLQRVLFLYDRADRYSAKAAQLYRQAAQRLGLVLVEQVVDTPEQVQSVLTRARLDAVDGILAPRCCALNIPGLILQAATRQHLPTMFVTNAYWMERGVLASYGSNTYTSGRQAARLVDKILRGTPPAKIPVEVNSQIEFSINLQTADRLGLTLAPDVYYQADHLVRDTTRGLDNDGSWPVQTPRPPRP